MNRIPITEEEHAALIMASTHDNTVLCAFGPGHVALLDTPENRWAMEHLAHLRVPDVTEPSPDWLASLGQPIPDGGREAAVEFLVSEGYDQTEAGMVIDVVAREVEHDQAARAIEYVRSFVGRQNETIVIMTLAHLCVPGGTRKVLRA